MGGLLERDKKDYKVLTEEDINFLLKSTSFTRQKIIEHHKNFIRDCPSGLLDKKTYIKYYQDLYPEGRAQKFCDQIFEKFDIDKNGKIDFNEYLLAMFTLSQVGLKNRLSVAFQMYDADKNGFIDKKELEKVIIAILELVGETDKSNVTNARKRVDEIFNQLDTNKDGLISEEEFIQGFINDASFSKLMDEPYTESTRL